MLQNRASLGRNWQIVYYASDLLELEGEDLKGRPIYERKKRLQQVVSGSEVRYNAELPGSADAVVRTVKQAGLEGVIAKRRDSIYRGSTRNTSGSSSSLSNHRSLCSAAIILTQVLFNPFWPATTKATN